jgi:hypothetical protein
VHSNRFSPKGNSRGGLRSSIGQKFLVGVSLVLLGFASGCGSSNSAPFPITGNFSNSSMNGPYAYVLSGIQVIIDNSGTVTQSTYREAGVFTADGNGNITTGTEDFNDGSGLQSVQITGAYSIAKDGTGVVALNVGGGTETWAVTMVSSSKIYLTEADAFVNFSANASGEADQQDASALNTVPSGTFVFGVHQTLTTPPDSATVGQFAVSNGIVSGHADVLQNNVLSQSTVTGTLAQLDSSGRGTFNFTASGVSNNFNYYVVNANKLLLMETDTNVLGLGHVEAQSGGPFSTASLGGNYAFGSSGDTASNISGVNSAGSFSVSNGAISAGTYDSVLDGNVTTNQGYTGTIGSVNSSTGRVAVSITPTGPGNAVQEVWYLVSPTRAFQLRYYPNNTSAGITEDGTVDQQVGSFSSATLKGQYGFLMSGFTNSGLLTRVGTFIPDGNGNLNINETTNLYAFGVVTGVPSAVVTSPIYLQGTYTVDTNGRGTASVNNLSNNLVLYMVSPNQAYILQGDSGVQMFGPVQLQQ